MANYSNQISTNRTLAGLMLSAYQENKYSLGAWDITQQKCTRVYQGAVVTGDYIVVGRGGSCETSTSVQSSTQKFTAGKKDMRVQAVVIDRRHPHRRIVYEV